MLYYLICLIHNTTKFMNCRNKLEPVTLKAVFIGNFWLHYNLFEFMNIINNANSGSAKLKTV